MTERYHVKVSGFKSFKIYTAGRSNFFGFSLWTDQTWGDSFDVKEAQQIQELISNTYKYRHNKVVIEKIP